MTFDDLLEEYEDLTYHISAPQLLPGFQLMKLQDSSTYSSLPQRRPSTVMRRRSSVRTKMHFQPMVSSTMSASVEFHEDMNLRSNSGKSSLTHRILEDFEEVSILGIGSYGRVYLVKDLITGVLYAKKTIKKARISLDSTLLKNSRNEKDILAKITHPGIVKLFYSFHDEEDINFILEYIPGGEIFYHLSEKRQFDENTTAFYMAQVAEAIRHLHSLGIVYRDLKPENVLLNAEGHAVLTDFGLSSTDEVCRSILGTPEFTAPEVLRGESYSYPADWWSYGVMMYDMLCGGVPFKGSDPTKLNKKIMDGKLQIPNYLSEDAKDIVRRLLQRSPGKRFSVDEKFGEFKKHRFFRKVNWKQLRSDVPPIIPDCADLESANNFDKEYISEALRKEQEELNKPLSSHIGVDIPVIVKREEQKVEIDETMFRGFSFVCSESVREKHFFA